MKIQLLKIPFANSNKALIEINYKNLKKGKQQIIDTKKFKFVSQTKSLCTEKQKKYI